MAGETAGGKKAAVNVPAGRHRRRQQARQEVQRQCTGAIMMRREAGTRGRQARCTQAVPRTSGSNGGSMRRCGSVCAEQCGTRGGAQARQQAHEL